MQTFVGTGPSQYRLVLRQDNFFSYQPNFDAFIEEENLVTSNASAFRIDSDNSRELKLKLVTCRSTKATNLSFCFVGYFERAGIKF